MAPPALSVVYIPERTVAHHLGQIRFAQQWPRKGISCLIVCSRTYYVSNIILDTAAYALRACCIRLYMLQYRKGPYMNRKNIVFLAAGMLCGIVLGCTAFSFAGNGEQPAVIQETTALLPTSGPSLNNGPVSDAAIQDTSMKTNESNSGIAEWSSQEVYLGGDRVIYQDRIYRAKWWTQNEKPDSSDVWEDTMEAPAKPEPASVQETEAGRAAVKNTVPADGFKVVAYYPSWSGEQFGKLQYDVLTHIVYAFAIPNPDGTLKPLENPELARKLIDTSHSHGARVLLAVGGWSYNDTPLEPSFMEATKNQETLVKFADNILALCNTYGFDGIDMDWEHPRVDGGSWQQYESLMLYLSEKLHAQGKVLTSAVISGATADGNVYYDAAAHTDKVLNAVDWIHVMAYDGGDGERHSPYDFAVNCGLYWKDTRKVPASKVVLGVPFYGRPSWASYENILSGDKEAWSKDSSNYNGMEAFYNGVSTIQKKTSYAKQNLGGIMIWEITQDTNDKEKSLLTAVKNGLVQ